MARDTSVRIYEVQLKLELSADRHVSTGEERLSTGENIFSPVAPVELWREKTQQVRLANKLRRKDAIKQRASGVLAWHLCSVSLHRQRKDLTGLMLKDGRETSLHLKPIAVLDHGADEVQAVAFTVFGETSLKRLLLATGSCGSQARLHSST